MILTTGHRSPENRSHLTRHQLVDDRALGESAIIRVGRLLRGRIPCLLRLENGGDERTRLAVRRLSQPGVVTRDGRVIVTDGLFGDGSLIRVRR